MIDILATLTRSEADVQVAQHNDEGVLWEDLKHAKVFTRIRINQRPSDA